MQKQTSWALWFLEIGLLILWGCFGRDENYGDTSILIRLMGPANDSGNKEAK